LKISIDNKTTMRVQDTHERDEWRDGEWVLLEVEGIRKPAPDQMVEVVVCWHDKVARGLLSSRTTDAKQIAGRRAEMGIPAEHEVTLRR
jgi:hypothetical protein